MSIIFRLNEVVGSTSGIDVEFVELIGTPGASLDGLSLIVVESDTGPDFGTIDRRLDFTAADVVGDNGFFLVGTASVTGEYGVTPDQVVPDNWIENSSYTIALVETSTLTGGSVTGAETVIDGLFFDDGENGVDASAIAGLVEIEPFMFGGVQAGAYRTAPLEATATRADYGIADFFYSGNTPEAAEFDDGGTPSAVRIHAVQGSGDSTPLFGQSVMVEGVVTRVFLADNEIEGFFLQEEDADADGDATTSEGIFVYAPGLTPGDVAEGQIVSVEGTAGEFSGQTQITLASYSVTDSGDNSGLVSATDVFGIGADDREQLEGMLVSMDEVTVTETFYLSRDNQYIVSEDGKLAQYSQLVAPGTANATDYDAFREANADRSIFIDDGSDRFDEQNPAEIEVIDGNDGLLDAADTFTMGDTLSNVTGVLSVDFNSFNSGGLVVRGARGDYADTDVAQEVPPAVDGELKIGSLNVQNFFTTLDDGGLTETGDSPRGADTASEYDRQLDKLVEQITTLDMDILGLQELENSATDSAIAALVDALNDSLGATVYAYVPTGLTGTGGDFPNASDQQPITNGIIYKVDMVEQVGETAILDSAAFLDPNGTGEIRNRPAVTASFEVIEGDASGQVVTVSSNHLKSKGSSGLPAGDAGNPDSDQGDGQGFWNDTRTDGATVLAAWLDGNPTGVAAENTLILGDLNSYAGEDPIAALMDAGYLNTVAAQEGAGTYSYVFGGEWGTLDYIMGKGTAFDGVEETGSYDAAIWNANAPFPTVYGYDEGFQPSPPGAQDLFDPTTPFRASDHDPVIVGLDLEALPRDDFAIVGPGGFHEVDVLGNDPAGFQILGVNGVAFGNSNRAIVVHGDDPGADVVVRLSKDGSALLVNPTPGETELTLEVTVGTTGPGARTYVTELELQVDDSFVFVPPSARSAQGFDARNPGDNGRANAVVRQSSDDRFVPGLLDNVHAKGGENVPGWLDTGAPGLGRAFDGTGIGRGENMRSDMLEGLDLPLPQQVDDFLFGSA